MNKFAISVGLISVALIGGIVWLATKAQNTGPLQGDEVASLGGQHIAPSQEHLPYNSNPPSSGPHYVNPQPAGIYEQELLDETVVHSLEHGGVWLTYKSDLAKDQIDALKNVARRNRAKVILSPREKNDSPVALVSWTRILKLDSVDEQAIKRFIRANRDHAPETVPL